MELDHRADAGERVGHRREQRAIAQRYERVGREAGEQIVHLLGRQNRRFAFLDHMFWSAHGMGRIVRDDLPDDEPVEEHAHSCEMLLDGRPGTDISFERLEPGSDMHRLDAAQLFQTMGRTPSRKAAHGAIVGAAGMVVGNLGDEEFESALSNARFMANKRRICPTETGRKLKPLTRDELAALEERLQGLGVGEQRGRKLPSPAAQDHAEYCGADLDLNGSRQP